MKISEMREEERPREKLLARGAKNLDDSELLAILLRTGTGKKNALEIASDLLDAAGNSLTGLAGFSTERMQEIRGIGADKAVTVAAAMELGKRFVYEKNDCRSMPVTGARQVFNLMFPLLKGLSHEECWIIYLARNNRIISKERLSIGGQSETIVEVKSVVRRALDVRAASVIISHNHPSGDPHPGNADIRLTQNLKKALETFDISLVDHVIFADGRYYSFADEMEYGI